MAYPTNPIAFPRNTPGENRSDAANLMGTEITAIETALLHPAAQTTAPIRLRQGGNLIEWGPAAAGKLSTLGSTNGKSFLGLGCEAGTTAGRFTTRAQAGTVVTHDGAAGLLVQSVPAVGTANQLPVTRFTVPRVGGPQLANAVLGSWGHAGVSVPSQGSPYTMVTFNASIIDPWGFHAAGTFTVPAALAGVYVWVAAVAWTANVTGSRGVVFTGTGVGSGYLNWQQPNADAPGVFYMQCVMTRSLAAGGQFTVGLLQNSGVTLTPSITLRMIKLL